jgi:predicted kinase
MSRVVFMCGPSGAGKTTYAKTLENGGMTRLSFDVEMWRRGITTAVLSPEDRADIEATLKDRLLTLVEDGRDVVLDFSFWSRQMREEWRHLLRPTGIVPETVYLATDRDTVLERSRARRGSHPDDYVLDESTVARYFDHFEAPTPEEGPLTVIR